MNADWLKRQFECHPDKSKKGLADKLGLRPSAISKILAGGRQIKAIEHEIMKQYFGISVDKDKAKTADTFYNTDTSQNNQWLRDESVINKDNAKTWDIPFKTRGPLQNKWHVFQIDDDLMAPDFEKGDEVLTDLGDKTPDPPGAFVLSDGFHFLVRQCKFIPDSQEGLIEITVDNPDFEPQTLGLNEISIIGRVIRKVAKL